MLIVFLPKGQTAQTALSSFVHPEDLDLLGVWDWLRVLFEQAEAFELQFLEAGPALNFITAQRGLITRLVLDGSNEFITPSLPVTLTHAVQQPLGLPTWTRLPIVHEPANPVEAAYLSNSFTPVTAWRSPGSHHAVLLGALQINGASTAAVDLEARWIEWLDDLSEPGPTQTQYSSHVDRIPLPTLDAGMVAADGSTNSRQVAVYVPRIDSLWFAAPFDQLDGVPAPDELAAPLHELGDTRHRMVRYRAVSSSRFQEYFPEPGHRDHAHRSQPDRRRAEFGPPAAARHPLRRPHVHLGPPGHHQHQDRGARGQWPAGLPEPAVVLLRSRTSCSAWCCGRSPPPRRPPTRSARRTRRSSPSGALTLSGRAACWTRCRTRPRSRRRCAGPPA